MRSRDMKEREGAILNRIAPIWHCRRRKEVKKGWDREWGELETEGNIWWLGSARQNWEQRMGKRVWGWFRECGFIILYLVRRFA